MTPFPIKTANANLNRFNKSSNVRNTPKKTEIREDLQSLHRIVSNTGQISFRASRRADGHNDRATALALAVRAAESGPVSYAPVSVGRRNPFLARPLYY